jgi:putative ABC transport system permease protein
MTGLRNWLSQLLVVTTTNLRTLPRRIGASVVAAVGVAGVVAVLVAVLSIAEGFKAALATTGFEDTALVLRGGTDTEMNSVLGLEDTHLIADAPGILRTAAGPVASAELFVVVDVPKRSTGTSANVPLRGVQPAAFEVRRNLRMVQGRRFEPGRNEIIAGIGAAGQFAGLDVGNTLRWGENEWTVVGIFAAEGTMWESELWCDVKVLQPAYRRGESYQSVYVQLESPDKFESFKDALTTNPRLDVKVMRERDYFAEQSEILHGIITQLGFYIAGLMAIGAMFGALNTMYSAVASRSREIATLRALGFGGGPVVLSVLAESILLSLGGGLIGAVAAYLAFNGYRAATINWSSFSQVAFEFRVTPQLMLLGLTMALVLGTLGGMLPAIRAMRLPVASALREL